MKPVFSVAIAAILLLVLSPVNTFACACCADRGMYAVSKGAISEYELEMFPALEFGPEAHLYLEPGEFDAIRGLDSLKEAYYASENDPPDFDRIRLESSFSERTWILRFNAGSGLTGSLALPVPSEMETFKVDIHDGKSGGAGGPLLYKELRFSGSSGTATGLFGKIPKGTGFSLIFQGRGNVCDNAEDFTHWRIEFREADARFSFFGKMASGNPDYFSENNEDGSEVGAAPRFEDYGAAVVTKKAAAVNLRGDKRAWMFRTRLRNAWKEGVNFAGSFIFTSWGCGTGCQVGAIIDVKTGNVFFPEELDGMGFGSIGAPVADQPIEFRKDSSLFILRGIAANGEADGTSYLVWDGKRFQLIRFVSSQEGAGSEAKDTGDGSAFLITGRSAGQIQLDMTIAEAETKYGKLKKIWMEGLTGDEYAAFSDHPKGLRIAVGIRADSRVWPVFTAKEKTRRTGIFPAPL